MLMRISVIGAGNGGQALAGYLALKGFDVSLYNRSKKRIETIMESKKLVLEGEIKATVQISHVTTNIADAVKGRKLILVAVPANAHEDIARTLAPHLEDGQVIVLNPGRTAGALEFRAVLRKLNVQKKVVIAEAETFIFASRIVQPGVVHIFGIKKHVPVAALPSSENTVLEETLLKVLPEFVIVPNTLYTSFNNIGAIFHPATTLLNIGWIESCAGEFAFYMQGMSPSVTKVLEFLDNERCAVAKAFGIKPMSLKEWLTYHYGVEADTLYDAIHSSRVYEHIKAPSTIENRYILEDVPTGLVPFSAFGKLSGVETPATDTIIKLASLVMGMDFYSLGRNLEKLCLTGKTVEEVKQIMKEGF